jgi:hypothetical protein
MGNWIETGSAGAFITPPPAPDAPNLVSSTCAPFYCDRNGNTTSDGALPGYEYFGFAGVGVLPISDPSYSHLKKLTLRLTDPSPSTRVQPLGAIPAANWAGRSTVTWRIGGREWPRPENDEVYQRLDFLAANEDDTTSPAPLPIISAAYLTVVGLGLNKPPQALTVTVVPLEVGVDPITHHPKQHIRVDYTSPEGWSADVVTAYLSRGGGGAPSDEGSDHARAGAGSIDLWVERPDTSKPGSLFYLVAWKNAWWVPLNTLTAPHSAGFTLTAPGAPSATGITDAVLGTTQYAPTEDGSWRFGIPVTLTTPTMTAEPEFYYAHFSVQLTDAAGNPAPGDMGQERKHVVELAEAGKAYSIVLPFDWPQGGWWIPPEDYPYREHRIKLYLYSRTDKETLQTQAWGGASYAVVVPTLADQPCLDVLMFRAGQSLGDGTFSAAMYWDAIRQRMLIDWAAVLPANRVNWSGVAVWVKTGDGSYVRATGVMTLEAFAADPVDGLRYLYDTLAFAPGSIPTPPETWTILAVSYDRSGNPKLDLAGNPTGPAVQLQTLPKSDHVLDLQVTLVRQFSESGDQVFGYAGSWTQPGVPRYRSVRIIERDFFGAGTSRPLSGEILLGTTRFETDLWQVPEVAAGTRIVVQPTFGDGSQAELDACPSVAFTIQRTAGVPGAEYAAPVTGFSAAVANPAYGTNGQGQKVLRVNLAWNNPADVRFGGVFLFVIWYDGRTIQLSGLERGAGLTWESASFPESTQWATFYALSADTNNRRNSYVPGVTPAVAVAIPAPALGAAGIEYTSNVQSFFASVSYPANSDGTYRAQITALFTPPSDPTWGGLELVTSDGSTVTPRLRARTSPAMFTVPVPAAPQTWTVYGPSFDVNGRRNSIAGSVPYASFVIGSAAGTLKLNKADPATFELTQFVIYNNRLKIFQVDGDLIVRGTVSSSALNATEVMIGGGGGKPGKLGVYNGVGSQIGFIGTEDGVEGGWLKTLGIGGPNKTSPAIFADDLGNTQCIDATFILTKRGVVTKLMNEMNSYTTAGVSVSTTVATSPMICLGPGSLYLINRQYNTGVASLADFDGGAMAYLRSDDGSRFLRVSTGPFFYAIPGDPDSELGPHVYLQGLSLISTEAIFGSLFGVNGDQVVGKRRIFIPEKTTRTAGDLYTENEKSMLNELKRWHDSVHRALSYSAGGHGLWP